MSVKEIKPVLNEKEIISISAAINSKKSKISLTNYRIYQETKISSSKKQIKVIPLDKIDSFGIESYENKILLILGIILLLSGVGSYIFGSLHLMKKADLSAFGFLLVIFGIINILIWHLTKKVIMNIISISGESKISVEASGENQNSLFEFLEKIHLEILIYSQKLLPQEKS